MADSAKLQALPSVHEVVERLPVEADRFPRGLVVGEVRRTLDAARRRILAGDDVDPAAIEREVLQSLDALTQPPS